MTQYTDVEVVADGFCFTEGPRWHEGRLWFSDMHDGWVCALTPNGQLERIARVEHEPSGLGWLPDGRLLVVSMQDRRLIRREMDGTFVAHADLGELATFHCNDMVVDGKGRAWVGNFGFDLHGGAAPTATVLIRVDPDGSVHCAAANVMFPNGCVITPDGATLIVAETFGACLTAFDISSDGALSNRRSWAQLPEGAVPDGICLDAEGIWVASPTTNECLRLKKAVASPIASHSTAAPSPACRRCGSPQPVHLHGTRLDPADARTRTNRAGARSTWGWARYRRSASRSDVQPVRQNASSPSSRTGSGKSR